MKILLTGYHTLLPHKAQEELKKAHEAGKELPEGCFERVRLINRAIAKVKYDLPKLFKDGYDFRRGI